MQFADDNTLYSCDKELENIFVNLKIDLRNVLYWFQVNSLKANSGKFEFMILEDKKNNTFVLTIHDKEIKNPSGVELLIITIGDLLQEKGTSSFAFPTAFRRFQLSLTAFKRFCYINTLLKLG